jgi:hypothetical protein
MAWPVSFHRINRVGTILVAPAPTTWGEKGRTRLCGAGFPRLDPQDGRDKSGPYSF